MILARVGALALDLSLHLLGEPKLGETFGVILSSTLIFKSHAVYPELLLMPGAI